MSEPSTPKERILDSLRRSKNPRTYADLAKSLEMAQDEVEHLVLELGREGKLRIHEPSARARAVKIEIFKERITSRMLAPRPPAAGGAPGGGGAAGGGAAAPLSGEDLERRIVHLETDRAAVRAEVAELRRRAGAGGGGVGAVAAGPIESRPELAFAGFRAKCGATYDELAAEGRLVRVAIPALRRALADRYSAAEFDRYLLEMERAGEFELVAAAPGVPDADRTGGIDHPQRGLLLTAQRRSR
ncbi:MAG: hypothetical protein HZA54_06225 [Planctomycetes bacterium]|nr:hypothetical protein [Planctomycetota bacterium]